MISSTRTIEWPDPDSIVVGPKGYKTPEGVLPRVTSILRVLGLGTEGLIKWAANEERKAVLEAVRMTAHGAVWSDPEQLVDLVEKELGPARQHQKQLTKAGEIGTEAHAAIHDYLKDPNAPQEPLSEQAQWALMAFQDWWKETGLKSIKMEQPVWDAKLGYAGTIDLIAEHPRLGLGVVDFKTSKGLYDTHHLQVAAYMHAGENWAELRWAQIVRLPKNLNDPKFEMKPVGKMYDRTLDQKQLMDVFRAALTVYKTLVAK